MCGLYFLLRGGSELRGLKPQHITVNTSSSGEMYLLYRETGSKNNPGGINSKRVNNKEVPHFKNQSNPSRDFVSLYMLYRPPEAEFLFLQSIKRPSGSYWYCNKVVGHNALAGTVKRLCSLAGIVGKKTNHSLRATAATRLFQEGIDEQLIMNVTGHRSTDGVQAYKRVSIDQYKQMSTALQHSKCITADEPISIDNGEDKKSRSKSPPETTDTTSSTKLPSFVLTNCTGVTINFTK